MAEGQGFLVWLKAFVVLGDTQALHPFLGDTACYPSRHGPHGQGLRRDTLDPTIIVNIAITQRGSHNGWGSATDLLKVEW